MNHNIHAAKVKYVNLKILMSYERNKNRGVTDISLGPLFMKNENFWGEKFCALFTTSLCLFLLSKLVCHCQESSEEKLSTNCRDFGHVNL